MAGAGGEARFAGLSLVQLNDLLEDEGQLTEMVQKMEEVSRRAAPGVRGAARASGARDPDAGRSGKSALRRGLGVGGGDCGRGLGVADRTAGAEGWVWAEIWAGVGGFRGSGRDPWRLGRLSGSETRFEGLMNELGMNFRRAVWGCRGGRGAESP